MGITGLIPFLEKASTPINIRQYKGQTIAVDAYCWLHRGIFSCAEKIARGEKCDAYITYCLKYVNMLIAHDIKPILVFDGRYLPAKAATEKKRRQSREQNRAKAAELLRQGRTAEARRCLRNSVDVGPEMAVAVERACRSVGADCIVAPFEADAQLAYLNRKGIASAVVTEDSDLILFGCLRVIFKLDLMGCGLQVLQDQIHLAMGVSPEKFSMDRFRQMCILSGCDYLPSLPGIGLAKAKKFVNSTSSPDISQVLGKLPSATGMYNLQVTEEYIKEFAMADATFLYQLVYDPIRGASMPLNDPNLSSLHSELVVKVKGDPLPPETEYQLALGNLNPFNLRPIDDFNPHGPNGPCGGGIGRNGPPKRKWKSIWDKTFVPWGDSKNFHSQDALMTVERDSTLGKEAVMGVGFFQSQEHSPVRRSPRKRKHKMSLEDENMQKEVICSNEDLGLMYGPVSPKKQRKKPLLLHKDESDLGSLNESNSMVVTEVCEPEEAGSQKMKLNLFNHLSSPKKKGNPLIGSFDLVNQKDGRVEAMKIPDQECILPSQQNESCDANSTSGSRSCNALLEMPYPLPSNVTQESTKTAREEKDDYRDKGNESSCPKSPIIGKRNYFNPFAKSPNNNAVNSCSIGSFLKTPTLFCKQNVTPGVKTVVKSRYFVSSPPKEIEGPGKNRIFKNKSPLMERRTGDILLHVNDSKEESSDSVSDTHSTIDILGSHSEPLVEVLSSPSKRHDSEASCSRHRLNDPFSLDSGIAEDTLLSDEKSGNNNNCSIEEATAKGDSFMGDDAGFSGPCKGLFNWSSLKDKFSFFPVPKATDETNSLGSFPIVAQQRVQAENNRKNSFGSTPKSAPGQGRGRGQNCRQPGLGRGSTPRAKNMAVKGSGSQQSLLSRFGFQRK